MKKIIILLALMLILCGAKKNNNVVVSVCKNESCFNAIIDDVVNYKIIKLSDGSQYIRFYTKDNQVKDLNVSGKEFKINK